MALLDDLRDRLRDLDQVVVAFSGGADSALLAWVAHATLGPGRVAAVTAVSPSLAGLEHRDCAALATEWGLRWSEVFTDEMHNAAYQRNEADRCFWCKDALMDAVAPLTASDGARAGATWRHAGALSGRALRALCRRRGRGPAQGSRASHAVPARGREGDPVRRVVARGGGDRAACG